MFVDFGVTIGTYRNPGNGSSVPTSWGTVPYSKSGTHLVPARPRPSRGESTR
ncbi:MAG: polymorphic toxin type 50 domain-containing protein [Actinomycetales bacterium]